MNSRWTIRSVDDDAREIVGRARETTGMSAGEIVSEAIFEWARANPDALKDERREDEEHLAQSVQRLREMLAEQTRLLQKISA